MPFYEYEPDNPEASCEHCAEGFEELQMMKEDALTSCPKCGEACHKVLSTFQFSTNQGKQLLSQGNLEANGFTQYTKNGKGTYEKTAGKGPQVITEG